MVTLRQFEYFVGIIEEGSFTRAAQALHVSQPALSHQIAAMEKELGAPLLERFPRTVRLTATGRMVLPHAREALSAVSRVSRTALQKAGMAGGELRVATVYSVSLGILPEVLRRWNSTHPGIKVRLFEHRHATDLRTAMLAGEADLAIGPRPENWSGPIHHLKHEAFVVVLASGDDAALPDTADINLADLSGRRWVHYAPDNGLSEILDDACNQAGFRPEAAVRTGQTGSAVSLAAAGLGPALVPADIIPEAFTGRVLNPRPGISRELVIYARDFPDPLVAALIRAAAGVTGSP